MALSARQAIFVKAYLVHRNAKRAAKESHTCANDKVAESTGSRLLRNAKVAKAVAEGLDKLTKKFDLSAEQVLTRISEIAFNKRAEHKDILKGCELLGRYFKLFTDVQEHTLPVGSSVKVILTMPSNGSEAPKKEDKKNGRNPKAK